MIVTDSTIAVSPAEPGGTDLIADLLVERGPFASVYLPADSGDAGAIERLTVHASNAARSLEANGWSQHSATEVRQAVIALGPHGGATIAVIATPDRIVLSGHLSDPYEARVTVDTLPDVAPLLDSASRTLSHVIVLADRAGADIFSVAAPGKSTVAVVEGDTEHLHRGHPGGWSQRRFQQRAENTWEQNAGEVADEVCEAVDDIDAKLIVVAGDVRATGFLLQALGSKADLVVEVDGSRHADRNVLAARITDAVASKVAERRAEKLSKLRDALAAGHASSSAVEVVKALRRGAVHSLFTTADPPGDRTASFSVDDPLLLALDRSELHDLAANESIMSGSLVSAALRSAVAQGAHIEMVPKAAMLGSDHLAATLRFDLGTDT